MCFVPRCVSLDVTLRSKEGKKGENGRFSSFSFLWFLALCHQKLKFRAAGSPLFTTKVQKNDASEE